MSTPHTPGPWRLVTFPQSSGIAILGPDEENGPVYVANVESGAAPNRHACTAPRGFAAGNADLIASAPTLLAERDALAEQVRTLRDVVVDALRWIEATEYATGSIMPDKLRAALAASAPKGGQS